MHTTVPCLYSFCLSGYVCKSHVFYPAGTQNIQEAHTSTALIVAVVVSVVSLIGVCVIAICVVVAVLLACKRKANRKITSPKNTKTKKLDDDNYELFNVLTGTLYHVYESWEI